MTKDNQKENKEKQDEKKPIDLETTGEKEVKTKEEIKEKKDKGQEAKDLTREDLLKDLPDEIKKKLESKKAENAQKSKKIYRKKKKSQKKVAIGKAYVTATYNNTIVTLTDLQGNVLSWASAGIAGFKGPKKSTPYAAQIITKLAVAKARGDYGLNEVSVIVKGVGTGREAAIRALNINGINVTSIKDITPIPHNGCRPRKPRRV